jgi:hypothetical protein
LIVYKKLHVFLVYPDPLRSAINEEVRTGGGVAAMASLRVASPSARARRLVSDGGGVEE